MQFQLTLWTLKCGLQTTSLRMHCSITTFRQAIPLLVHIYCTPPPQQQLQQQPHRNLKIFASTVAQILAFYPPSPSAGISTAPASSSHAHPTLPSSQPSARLLRSHVLHPELITLHRLQLTLPLLGLCRHLPSTLQHGVLAVTLSSPAVALELRCPGHKRSNSTKERSPRLATMVSGISSMMKASMDCFHLMMRSGQTAHLTLRPLPNLTAKPVPSMLTSFTTSATARS